MSLQIRGDFPGVSLAKTQFQIGIRPSPDERDPGHPIFAVDGFPRMIVLFRRQNACLRIKFGASHSSTNRARRDPYLRIVANPFRLAHVAAGHYVEFAAIFSKPHWRGDAGSGLAKCGQRNIFLIVNGGRNLTWHGFYLNPRERPVD